MRSLVFLPKSNEWEFMTRLSKVEEWNTLDSKRCSVLMYINFNIPVMEYYAAIKMNVKILYVLQWKDSQDTLWNEKKKIKVKKVYILCHLLCK